MDLPDAARDRDRGLPLEPDPPSVRLLRPSVPYSDPEHDRSLLAFVETQDTAAMLSPLASPGITTILAPADEATTTIKRWAESAVLPQEHVAQDGGGHCHWSLRLDKAMREKKKKKKKKSVT